MSKIDIISGFLGAGKTTLIGKLIEEAYQQEQIVLIENEFGEIGIDGAFLQDSGVIINEMTSGCICCSLVGDFERSLRVVLSTYHPDRIIIEPSGVGKLSDIIKAVSKVNSTELELTNCIAVIDSKKYPIYSKNFGEFYNNQVENATLIVLSRSQDLSEAQLDDCLTFIRGLNDHAPVITTPWNRLSGRDILDACSVTLTESLIYDDTEDDSHEHHHPEYDCKEHHHHNEDCCCHHHNHEHHHADDVFQSIGFETVKRFDEAELRDILAGMDDKSILRAKGYVNSSTDDFWYFDFVPEEFEIRTGKPLFTGQVCVIGKDLDKEKIKSLFGAH